MLVTSSFVVDLFQMKHTKDQAGLLAAMKDANAAALGRKIIELFPYEKVDGYEGELPEMSLNRDHKYTDSYAVELVVLDVKVIRQHIEELENNAEEFVRECNDRGGYDMCMAMAEELKRLLL